MHAEALAAVAKLWSVVQSEIRVPQNRVLYGIDFGGRNVNGSARHFFENVTWHGLDIRPGPDVDIVADAAEYRLSPLSEGYDIVLSTELLEHAEYWRDIIQTMWHTLDPGGLGVVIITCASTGRSPHGASGEWGVPTGEWYGNVHPQELHARLSVFFERVVVEYNPNPGDAYAFARLPRDVGEVEKILAGGL